jgi:glycosyltransferase involved in cell wall biosynthesis
MPSVSIVIPTHNRCEMTCEAIESALAQTFDQCEVVVVDDGSTDGTTKALRRIFGSRIVLHQSEHSGVSRARNIGIKLSSGDYIRFLDSDDKLPVESIERQVQDTRKLGPKEVAVGLATELGKPEFFGTNHNLADQEFEGHLSEHLILGTSMPAWLPLFPRTLLKNIGGFNSDFYVSEDYEMCIRILAEGFRFHQFPTICYQLRKHDGARLSRELDAKSFDNIYRVMLSVESLVHSGVVPGKLEINKNAISLRAWSLGRRAARRGLKTEANRLFMLSKYLNLSHAETKSQPVIVLGKLIGPYRTERMLMFTKKLVRVLIG